jgi:hypothetical protein
MNAPIESVRELAGDGVLGFFGLPRVCLKIRGSGSDGFVWRDSMGIRRNFWGDLWAWMMEFSFLGEEQFFEIFIRATSFVV